MIPRRLLVLFFLIFSQILFCQRTIVGIDSTITDVRNKIAPVNPKKAIEILVNTKKAAQKISYQKGIVRSSYTLMLLYYNEGNYGKVIEESTDTERAARISNNNEYLSDVHRMRSIAYDEMGLGKEALDEIEKAIPYANKIPAAYLRHYKKAIIYEGYAGIFNKKEQREKEIEYRYKSIAESKKVSNFSENVVNAKAINLALQYSSLALAYKGLKQKDSTIKYFDEAQKIYDNKQYTISNDEKAILFSEMALFQYEDKNYEKAIHIAKNAERFEKKSALPYVRRNIYKTLYNSYAGVNRADSSNFYLKHYTTLNDSLIAVEKENIYKPVNQILSDKDKESKNTLTRTVLGITLAAALLFVLGWLFWRNKNNTLRKDYEKLIQKLKEQEVPTSQSDDLPQQTIKNPENQEKERGIQISNSTVNALLSKLEEFEKSDLYLKKNINLNYLANFLESNHRYVSETIRDHKEKTFSNYINDLRIDYITKVLYNEPKFRSYKISYLAEVCGFSSREVFAAAFKKRNNISPSYFIENLKDNHQNPGGV